MGWLVALAFLVMPILEIFVIIQVGQVIGAWPTVALLIVESAFGAWLVKREGRRAWRALNTALQTGRMPGKELSDAALVLVGGTLLLTPGFVTDVFGFFFILPFTRPLARRLLWGLVKRRALAGGPSIFIGGPRGGSASASYGPFGGTTRPRAGDDAGDDVVQGEVVDPGDR